MIDKKIISSPINKTVLLASSGMDTYIINRIINPDILLFINNKSKYSDVERTWLLRNKFPNLVILDDFINMSEIELDNFIVPLRNLYFISIATYFGDNIVLGATYGDRSTDKDFIFQDKINDLLRYIYSESHWCEARNITLNLQFKDWTKQDLIKEFVRINKNNNISKEVSVAELALNSFSCYSPVGEEQCNRCKPDIRKFLSILGATGIDTSKYYSTSPREYFTEEVIEQWIADLKNPINWRGRESEEVLDTLKRMRRGEI